MQLRWQVECLSNLFSLETLAFFRHVIRLIFFAVYKLPSIRCHPICSLHDIAFWTIWCNRFFLNSLEKFEVSLVFPTFCLKQLRSTLEKLICVFFPLVSLVKKDYKTKLFSSNECMYKIVISTFSRKTLSKIDSLPFETNFKMPDSVMTSRGFLMLRQATFSSVLFWPCKDEYYNQCLSVYDAIKSGS